MKIFREPTAPRRELFLTAMSVDQLVPEDAYVRTIDAVIDKLDIENLLSKYRGGGAPSYHPKMLLKLIILAYFSGIRSSRQIAQLCRRDLWYMFLCEMQTPDFRTIARFRRANEETFRSLFIHTVQACQEDGLFLLDNVAVDGTKIEANVSGKRTYSLERAEKEIANAQAAIDRILEEAEAADNKDDLLESLKSPSHAAKKNDKESLSSQLGEETAPFNNETNPKKQEDDIALALEIVDENQAESAQLLPENASSAQKEVPDNPVHPLLNPLKHSIERLEHAKAALEEMENSKRKTVGLTDPDSRVMKTRSGNRSAFNAQAAVDAKCGVIVSAEISQSVNDDHLLPLMADAILATAGSIPAHITVDTGYSSPETLAAMKERGIDAYIVQSRLDKARDDYLYDSEKDIVFFDDPVTGERAIYSYLKVRRNRNKKYRLYQDKKTGKELWYTLRPDIELQLKTEMKTKLASISGKAIYRRRQETVEPTFGHLKSVLNLRRFLLRKLAGASIEFLLACACHNIKKLAKWSDFSVSNSFFGCS